MRAWTRLRGRFSGSAPAEPSAGKDLLKWTAAAFALVATATAEYDLARAIGMNEWVAAAVPGALDAYVVRALRAHREVLTAVLAMVAVNAGSHLVTADVLPVAWPLITAVSAIAPLVLWRVHALGTPGEARRRVLWGLSTDEHAAVHASTEPEHTEHERAPDNPEPPGTREHPENTCDWCGYSYRGLDVPFHKEHACAERFEHKPSTDQARVHAASTTGDGMPYLCPHGCTVWGDVGVHIRAHEHMDPVREHTAGTLYLDVPEWVNPPSTPAVPVHAPYDDHVPVEPTGLLTVPGMNPVRARHLEVVRDGFSHVHGAEHAPDPVCLVCSHRAHDLDGCYSLECACTHTASTHEHSTRTADDWNLEHVSTGVLEPEDTEHMERARELFHTAGGQVPTFRALKDGTPGMGTPRAKRIRAALKAEAGGES